VETLKEVRIMSHKNYSKFSENTTETVETEPAVVIESTAELPEVPTQGYLSVEEIDSTGNTIEDVGGESTEAPEMDETVIEEPKAEEPEVTEEPKTELKGIGIVSGCKKLNVRAEASIDADIVTVISAGTEVVIENTEDDFYKVCTGDGKIGYCMKKFIVIK